MMEESIESKIDRLTLAMIAFDKGDAMRIQHFLKVHRFAQLIARQERVDAHTQLVTEMARGPRHRHSCGRG